MSLNKTFTCNIIKDEDDNDIDCYYQGFHIRTRTWNDVRFSENFQYSANLGDDDWLGQEGEVKKGDKILLCFWFNGEDRNGLKDRLSSIIVELTNDNAYVNDVLLKPKTNPKCGFRLNKENLTVNTKQTTTDISTDDISWKYNDIVHYHHRTIENELIFDSIGNLAIKYDWDAGDGWGEESEYSYTEIGDYSVSQRVLNQYDLKKICTQDQRVKYNRPQGHLDFIKDDIVKTTDNVDVNADIIDDDSTITQIKHKLIIRDRDNGDLLQDIEIEENTDLDYSYNRVIEVLQKHYFTQIILWNDGYDDRSIEYTKELKITNWCPEVQIYKEDYTELDKVFSHISNDKDGEVVKFLWRIYFIAPFKDEDFTLVHEFTAVNSDEWEVQFNIPGIYKIQIEVTDDYGCSTSSDLEIEIYEEYCSSEELNFIFPQNNKIQLI